MPTLIVSQCSNTEEITVLQWFQKASLLTGSLFLALPSETFLVHHSSPQKPSDGLKHFLYSFQISQSLLKKTPLSPLCKEIHS